jgi:cyclophilin family peptidyl-prolyl cis-trans isomerase
MAIHYDWAPIGAKHFVELVNAGYYNGAPWFRVIPGFMCQCGIAADPAVTKKWQDQTIQDEPVKQGNTRGMVSFGKSSAPNSRSTHIFINYVDNSRSLDPQGFSAFAEVISGMEVADKFKATGESVGQGELSAQGIDYFKKLFPDGDVITRAYLKKAGTK